MYTKILLSISVLLFIRSSSAQDISAAIQNHDTLSIKALIASGGDINQQGKDGIAPIIWAIRLGDSTITNLLLNYDADVNIQRDSFYMTPLIEASMRGHYGIVKTLLEHGAKVNKYALTKAFERKIFHSYNFFDQHKEPLEGKIIEKTALMVAAEYGHADIVRLLLMHGANINDQAKHSFKISGHKYNGAGETPLIYAVEFGCHDVIKVLLEKKAKANIQAEEQLTLLQPNISGGYDKPMFTGIADFREDYAALHVAASLGDAISVRLLMEAEADVDIEDAKENTPLILATSKGHYSVIEMLIEKGANVNVKKNTFQSPLIIAAQNGDAILVEYLLSKGVYLHQKAGESGIPILSFGILGGNMDVVKCLCAHGASVDEQTNNGTTPIMIAAGEGKAEIMNFLINRKANINAGNDNGHTALMFAAKNGHSDCVNILLKSGSDINLKDKQQRTALKYAKDGNYQSIIDVLLKAGAKE